MENCYEVESEENEVEGSEEEGSPTKTSLRQMNLVSSTLMS